MGNHAGEQRRRWVAGLSPANIIALLIIISTGAAAWGIEITQTRENTQKIEKLEKTTRTDMKEMEERITIEIIKSEERTNDRIGRMEDRIGDMMGEIKRAITKGR